MNDIRISMREHTHTSRSVLHEYKSSTSLKLLSCVGLGFGKGSFSDFRM